MALPGVGQGFGDSSPLFEVGSLSFSGANVTIEHTTGQSLYLLVFCNAAGSDLGKVFNFNTESWQAFDPADLGDCAIEFSEVLGEYSAAIAAAVPAGRIKAAAVKGDKGQYGQVVLDNIRLLWNGTILSETAGSGGGLVTRARTANYGRFNIIR